VINGIKGSRELKDSKSSDFLLSHGLDDVIMNRKKRGCSGMVCKQIEKSLKGD